MKQLIIITIILFTAATLKAQDFKQDLATARTAYSAGKLEDAHFALQQAFAEMDIIIGKKVLELLPLKMDSLNVNSKDDNVYSNVGFIGATIHRSWEMHTQTADLSIINNSPLIGTISAFINSPLGGMMNSDKSKMVKVQGYKARLEKEDNSNGLPDYTLEIPLASALITFKVNNTSDAQIISFANTLPLSQIAKLIQ